MGDQEFFRAASNLDHLLPWAGKLAALPTEERLRQVRGDRWIGYTTAQTALAKLEQLFTHPSRQRMPNLLIIGPTNNGKTMIVEKFRRMHPAVASAESDAEDLPVVGVQMPSAPTVARFYSLLLFTLNAPVRSRTQVAPLEALALRILQRTNVRLLVIDEVHNILAGTSPMQREFLNLIRFLGNHLRIPIVCVGTKDAYYALRSDNQLENRFEPLTLPVWQDDAELASLLASFEAVLPLRRPSGLATPELARLILARSEGTIGEITALLTRAAIMAMETGEEAITRSILLHTDYASPSERRRTFERDLA